MSRKVKENNVTVGVRIRPLNENERSEGMKTCFLADNDGVTIQALNEKGIVDENLGFSYAFGPKDTNQSIFDKISPNLVETAMEGMNSVLFMYGQTSSGKTFTLFGSNGTPGLIQYTMDQVEASVHKSVDTEFVIR